MLWDTGARNGELLSLDISDIDSARRRAIIRTEKSRGWRPIREIFWTDPTNRNLERWMAKRADLAMDNELKDLEALFISVCNFFGRRLSLKGIGEMLRRYCNRAKIPCINAHSFRHHMGHDIIRKGGSSADVMNILGHASIQSSAIYTMMNDRELETRYRKFKGR
jgi:site-specific recombinase XerD